MTDYTELKRIAQRVIDIEALDGGEPIGDAWGEFEASATPAAVLALIAESERLRENPHMRAIRSLSGDCADLIAERDQLKTESDRLTSLLKSWRDQAAENNGYDEQLRAEIAGLKTGYEAYEQVNAELKAEVEALRKDRTDWQAECLKRGFEYVRESDDHYVLADVPEMADLLGSMLGVEVRSKENDGYEEANSQLSEQIEGLINTIHSQESMRKDAERWRFVRNPTATGSPFAVWSERTNLFLGKFADEAIDAAMSQGEQS